MNFETKINCHYLDKKNNEIIISINGEMETFYTKFFNMAITALLDDEKQLATIFFDLKMVKYISSSFVASLLHVINKAKFNGIEIFFINCNPYIKNVIDTMGFLHFIKQIDLKTHKSITVTCTGCKKKITIKKLGEFRCPHCNTLLNISDRGVVK